MDTSEQARFDALYAQHLGALKLQGKAAATIDGYARAVRRVAAHFDRCPDRLQAEDFNGYFASLLDSRSWSLVKIDRCGLQFFYRHVPERDWDWVRIVRPPHEQRIPGFCRSRSYGLLRRVQLTLRVVMPPAQPRARRPVLCWRCGNPMRIRVTRRGFPMAGHAKTQAMAAGSATV